MVADGNYPHHGKHRVMHKIVESQCCTSKTNIILYVNYNSIKNKQFLLNITHMHKNIMYDVYQHFKDQ